MAKKQSPRTTSQQPPDYEELQSRLKEAEEILFAIRNGDLDAIFVSGTGGDKVFSLASAETPYRIILEEMSEGAVTVTSDGIILYCNQSFADMLSVPLEKIIGSNCLKYILKGEKNKFKRILQKSLNGKAKGDISFIEKDGRIIHMQLSFHVLPPDMEADICIVASDITQKKKYQHNLKELVKKRTNDLEILNYQLHRELKEHSLAEKALKESEIQLIELNATKDKFFNIIAHDLKNPFTSLLGSTELLFDNIYQMDSEKIRALAQILNDSAKSGYAILQNLLDWSRSQTGLLKYNPERINVKDLIKMNLSDIKLSATNKEISLHSEVKKDIYLFADKNMINTVLRNLLNNAIKFTRRGGNVIVRASFIRKVFTVSVRDTGIGISEENINKLFRLDSKYTRPGTDNEQGTGLGLKLSKEFVEKQGGKIWVKSIENRGSEFLFSIPAKEK